MMRAMTTPKTPKYRVQIGTGGLLSAVPVNPAEPRIEPAPLGPFGFDALGSDPFAGRVDGIHLEELRRGRWAVVVTRFGRDTRTVHADEHAAREQLGEVIDALRLPR